MSNEGFRRSAMSLVDDLIENLVERNAIDVDGTLSVALVDGGLRVRGKVLSAVKDEKKRKVILKVEVPVDAQITVAPVVIPVPHIK
jgi:hypothetical protein